MAVTTSPRIPNSPDDMLYEIMHAEPSRKEQILSDFTRFAIILDKVPNKESTSEIIQRHIEHLKKLDQQGKLVLCGPFTDFPSGMVIVKASDKTEAEAIAKADPFVIEGVRTYKVHTWLLACAENEYLG